MVQIDPDQLIDKLTSFVFHVCRLAKKHPYDAADIIAVDQSSAWLNIVSATRVDDTGKKKL